MAYRQGDEVKQRYSIRLEPSKKAELVKKYGTLQAGIEAALNLDVEKHLELAHDYALEEVKDELSKLDRSLLENGRHPKSELYWRIFSAFRDGFRAAKGH